MPKKPTLDYNTKQVIYNVYAYFNVRKTMPSTPEYSDEVNLLDLVSEVTGVSKKIVLRVVNAGNALKRETGIASFKVIKKQTRNKKIKLNVDKTEIIKEKIMEYYNSKNEVPNLTKLNKILKDNNILDCSHEYLRKLMHKLGFTHLLQKIIPDYTDNRIVHLQKYINEMREHRASGKSIFYVDETARWPAADRVKRFESPPDLVAVHAHGSKTFLDGSLLMFKFKSKTYCQRDAKFDFFENYDWLKENFVLNLPPCSIVVLNTPLSTKADKYKPCYTATRSEMCAWLNDRNVPYRPSDNKSYLHYLISQNEPLSEYRYDKLLIDCGHKVLYLHSKNYDLNPMLMAMTDIIVNFTKVTTVKEMFTKYPIEKWQECFNRVKKNEDDYYEKNMKKDMPQLMLTMQEQKEINQYEDVVEEKIESVVLCVSDESEDMTY